jgi:hypothetical protein
MRLARLLPISVLLLAGCGGSHSAGSTSGSTTVPPPTSTTTVTTDPLEGASTTAVSAKPTVQETGLLERIAVGRHEGYDRVVFQFRNHVPGYRVEYVQPPFAEDGSGNPVAIAGEAFVQVRMEPASGFDLNTGEGELVYKGPRRIEGTDSGAGVVTELVRTGDFEALLTWVIGLEKQVPFRVLTLDGPPRLVLDFRNT